jgi:hypothetical protein
MLRLCRRLTRPRKRSARKDAQLFAEKWCEAPALEAGPVPKEQADDRVERSLYQRAVGYTYESCEISCRPARRKWRYTWHLGATVGSDKPLTAEQWIRFPHEQLGRQD